ncbi:IS110 family RNA-guided transposase [Agrobacterium tumefaciens]|uniref:IS110 family transposase n=1 Tax=Agrobacterium tumefaciens TaxID=358 RepID=UPI000200AF91|nr:IS110 family transposase [Agrobacterium tumefaciens]ADY66007.1 transposase IS116/IS110/IS902 family protein [Agrobacterium tumefaciens]
MNRNQPQECAVFGIDIGKKLFHVVGLDYSGAIVQRVKFQRETLLQFFERAHRTLDGMEACAGSQWLAPKLQTMGYSVRIIPAQFVEPYVKSNKNDIIDAAATAEAATRPTMRFVGVKQADQVDLQMLHRVRSRLVSARTNLICQMRAYCLEHGIAMRQGAGVFKVDICRVMDDLDNNLTPMARSALRDLLDDFRRLEARIRQVSDEIEKIADTDERARRLMTIPGIGPLGATAILSAIGNPTRFSKAPDVAAWLGLVPRQYSTGGKQNLLGISKPGNNYLRRLIIHGARSCMLHLDRRKDRLGVWIDTLRLRMHVNKVAVALAAKLARIVWVVLTKAGATYLRQVTA